MFKFKNTRGISMVMLASVMTTACTGDQYGSRSSNATAAEVGETDGVTDWGDKSPEPYDDCGEANYEGAPELDGRIVDPDCDESCEYVSANFSMCADDAKVQAVLDREKKLKDAAAKRHQKRDAAVKAVGDVLTAADVKASVQGKFGVVLVKGDKKQKIGAVPNEVREAMKKQFTDANKAANGGWVYSEEESMNATTEQYLSQAELDRFVDATNKGAGGLLGISAYKVSWNRYAVVQGDNVTIFEYVETASNPYTTVTFAGEFTSSVTWPDDHALWDPVMKFLTGYRWKAYFAKAQAFVGTDPAKTREQMVQAAIDRAVQDAKDASNPFNWANVYEVIKVLPVTGTIDAIQRGDCPDAIASALTDLASLVGFWPAKVLRIGKLKVPGVVLMMALDGGAIAIKIAYKKDGAWVEAIITAAIQARALKQAAGMLLRTQRARIAAAGTTLAALSIACDNAEKAIDEYVAAEDEVLKARDELDKARIELEKTLKIPCDDDPTNDVDDGEPTTEITLDNGMTASQVCEASLFDGTLSEALAADPYATTKNIVPEQDAEATTIENELRVAALDLEVAVASGPVPAASACELISDTAEVTPVPIAEPFVLKTTDSTLLYSTFETQETPTTDTKPIQQQQQQPAPAPAPQPPVVCPAPPPHPAVSDLVDRYKKASETLQKIQAVIKARRAEINNALITSLVVTMAQLHGVGTDHIERLLTEHVVAVMKEFEKKKVAWDSDVERDSKLTFLIFAAEWAKIDKSLFGLPIKLTGKEKDDALAKLKSYVDSHMKNEFTETENFFWQMNNQVFQLAWAIYALPKMQEWVKNCTTITLEMFKEAGIPAPGKDPVVIDPVKFAEYVTKLDEALKKFEASLAKAAKKFLKE